MSKQHVSRIATGTKRVRDVLDRINKALRRGADAKSSAAVTQQKDYAIRALNDLVDVQADLRTNIEAHLLSLSNERQAAENAKQQAKAAKSQAKATKAAAKTERKTAVRALVANGTPKKAAKTMVKATQKAGQPLATPRAAWPFPTAASVAASNTPKADAVAGAVAAHKATAPKIKAAPKAKSAKK